MGTENHMDIDLPTSALSPVQAQRQDVRWVPPPSPSEGGYDCYGDPEGQWVVYYWKSENQYPGAQIRPFYERWPPSRTSKETCAWICVDRGRATGSPPVQKGSSEDMQKEFGELTATAAAAGKKVTVEDVDALAKKYNILSGKWMVYSNSGRIDQIWRRIAGVVCFDRRQGQVKVSPRKDDDDSHVICVYVDDYTNRADVDELRKALKVQAGVTWKIGFKPDVYTELGIYKGNEWGIRPSRYHDGDIASLN